MPSLKAAMRRSAIRVPGTRCQLTSRGWITARTSSTLRVLSVPGSRTDSVTFVPARPRIPATACSSVSPAIVAPVDLEDDVAGAQPRLARRRAVERRHDHHLLVAHAHLGADSREVPLQLLLVRAHHRRREKRAVAGVPQRVHHAAERGVGQALRPHGAAVDVMFLDQAVGLRDELEIEPRVAGRVEGGEHPPLEDHPACHREQDQADQAGQSEPVSPFVIQVISRHGDSLLQQP